MIYAARKYSIAIVLVMFAYVFLAGSAATARAEKLIMFDSPVCEWCEVWEEQIGFMYHLTAEARRAPLKRIDIGDQDKVSGLERRIIYTPTFVLMDKGREQGRITGYPGEDFFWAMLAIMIKRLVHPANTRDCDNLHVDGTIERVIY